MNASAATTWKPKYKRLKDSAEVVWTPAFVTLCLLVLYIPLQGKIDYRLDKHLDFTIGILVTNVLLIVALFSIITAGRVPGESRVRLLTLMVIGVIAFCVLGLLHSAASDEITGFLRIFSEWKRWISMFVLYFLALKALRTRAQFRMLLLIMSLLVAYAAFNLLKENFASGLSATRFKNGLRYGGIFDWGGENDLGAFLAEFVFVPLAVLFTESVWWKRWFALGTVALIILATIFTYSRGAWIGLAAGLLVYLCRRSVAKTIPIVVVAVILGAAFLPASVIDRWQMTENSEGQLESSAQMRVDVWNQGLDLVKNNPVLGVGYGRFSSFIHLERFGGIQLEPHNAYLKIAAEQGIPALLWYIGTLIVALAVSSGPWDKFELELARSFSGFWIAQLFVNMFGNRILREALIAYMLVFIATIARMRANRAEAIGQERPGTPARTIPGRTKPPVAAAASYALED